MAGKELIVKIGADVTDMQKHMKKASSDIMKSMSKATNAVEKDFTQLDSKSAKSAKGVEGNFKKVNFNFSKPVQDAIKKLDKIKQESKKSAEKGESAFAKFGANLKASIGKGVSKASASFKEIASEAKKNAEKAENSFEGMATNIKGALAGVAGALSVGAMSSFIDEQTENMKLTDKITTAFQAQKLSAEDAQRTYKDFYGILGDYDTAVEASQLLVNMTNDTKEMKKWTEVATGVYATFGDALPIEGMIESANETAKVGAVTGSLADALNWAGINEDKFNEKLEACKTEAERQDLIMNTLNDTYSETAKVHGKNSQELTKYRDAQFDMASASEDLARKLMPVKTLFMDLGSKAMGIFGDALSKIDFGTVQEKIQGFVDRVKTVFGAIKEIAQQVDWKGIYDAIKPLFEKLQGFIGSDEWQGFVDKLKEIAGNISDILVPALETVVGWITDLWDKISDDVLDTASGALEKINDALEWIKDNGETVSAIIMGIVAGITAYKIGMGLLNIAIGIYNGIQAVMNALMLISPFGWVCVAIAALVAVGILLYKNWDKIKAKAQELWKKLKEVFEKIKTKLSEIWDKIKEKVSTTWNNIKEKVVDKATEIWNKTKEKFESLKNKITSIWETVKTKTKNAWEKVKSWTVDKVVTMYNRIKEKFESLKTKVVSTVEKMKSGVQTAMKNVANKGFINPFNSIVKGIKKGLNAIISAINSIGSKIGIDKLIDKHFDDTKNVITPLAKGTNHWKGGTALVGEAGTELVSDPKLGTFLTPSPMLLPLSKGASVLRNSKTQDLLKSMGIPAYAKGKKESFLDKIKNGVKDVFDFVKKPFELLKNTFGSVKFGDNLGFFGDHVGKIKDFLADKLKGWIGKKLEENDAPKWDGLKGVYEGRWNNTAKGWARKALLNAGIEAGSKKFREFMTAYQIVGKYESGYNNSAWNKTDKNAKAGNPSKGWLQFIKTTFDAYKFKGYNEWLNPVHQAMAFINYANKRYGGALKVPGVKSVLNGGKYKPYANGGIIANPTMALMGEAGKEAVVPLSNSHALKPFGDAVANSITQQTGTQSNSNVTYEFTIPVMIDGRQVAQATATFTKEELDKLEKKQNRRNGKK